jgi:hypothetical protein
VWESWAAGQSSTCRPEDSPETSARPSLHVQKNLDQSCLIAGEDYVCSFRVWTKEELGLATGLRDVMRTGLYGTVLSRERAKSSSWVRPFRYRTCAGTRPACSKATDWNASTY